MTLHAIIGMDERRNCLVYAVPNTLYIHERQRSVVALSTSIQQTKDATKISNRSELQLRITELLYKAKIVFVIVAMAKPGKTYTCASYKCVNCLCSSVF